MIVRAGSWTVNWPNCMYEVPFIFRSIRYPLKPLHAFTPSPVPDVFQPVEVVVPELHSISPCGLVVVAEPPEYQVPPRRNGGADAAPFNVESNCTGVVKLVPGTSAMSVDIDGTPDGLVARKPLLAVAIQPGVDVAELKKISFAVVQGMANAPRLLRAVAADATSLRLLAD